MLANYRCESADTRLRLAQDGRPGVGVAQRTPTAFGEADRTPACLGRRQVVSAKPYLPAKLKGFFAAAAERHARELQRCFKSGYGKSLARKRFRREASKAMKGESREPRQSGEMVSEASVWNALSPEQICGALFCDSEGVTAARRTRRGGGRADLYG